MVGVRSAGVTTPPDRRHSDEPSSLAYRLHETGAAVIMGSQISENEQRAISPAAAPPTGPATTAGRTEGGDTTPGPSTAKIDAFRVECLMNGKYHAAREAYLNLAHRWIMFFVILVGTGTVLDALSSDPITKGWLGVLSAALGSIDLVFDLSNRACAHAQLKRDYYDLLADVIEGSTTIEKANAKIMRISSGEEPPFTALIALSWNEAQEIVYGDDAYAYTMPPFHRFFKNMWPFAGRKYKIKKPAKV